MKRILLAAGLAIAMHGFFLGIDPAWLKKMPVHKPGTRVVTMTLTYRQPERPKPVPVAKSPEIPKRKPPTVIEKKRKEPVHEPEKTKKVPLPLTPAKKPRPQKKVVVLKQEPSELPMSTPVQPPKPDLTDITGASSVDSHDLREDVIEEKAAGPEKQAKPSPNVQVAHVMREAKPLYQKNPPPEYPRLARRRGYEGTVVLEVLVDEEGKVEDMRLFSSSKHDILDRAAMASVKEWLFQPGMRGDKPAEMWVRVPIRFQLK